MNKNRVEQGEEGRELNLKGRNLGGNGGMNALETEEAGVADKEGEKVGL